MSASPNSPAAAGPRVVAAALFVHEGGLPLVRRAGATADRRWELPGGPLRRGEAPQAAAVREALEATGLRVAPLGILEAYAQGEAEVLIAYAADVLGGLLRPPAGRELKAFPPEELPWGELAFESTRVALRDYVRRYFPRVRIPR